MVTITIEMHALSEQRRELLLTLSELRELMPRAYGHIGSRLYIDHDNADVLMLVEDWNSGADVDSYSSSEGFQILLGAIKILTTFATITFLYKEQEHAQHRAAMAIEAGIFKAMPLHSQSYNYN